MIDMRQRAFGTVIAFALAGCAYVPDFITSKPKAPAAQDFRALREEATSAYAAEDALSKFVENGALDELDLARVQALLDALRPTLKSIPDNAGTADRYSPANEFL